ncbi:MAG: YihY/virulence factor BrkB family protein [Bacteroidota bacterium]
MVKQKGRLKNIFIQLGLSLKLLVNNDPLRLAGATAFFATFALPFILMILVQVLSLIFNRREISRELFIRMSSILGEASMQQVVVTIRGFRGLVSSWWAITAGSLFMVFVATTLFRVIKNSFNQLWMIRVDPEQKLRMSLMGRLQSLVLILFTGLLFVAGVVLEALQVLFGKYINDMIPGTGLFFNGILSFLISIFITSLWFAVLFHFIPNGRSKWKVSFTGGLLTALLFALGKFVLKRLLIDSNIDQVFGRSGAFVLVLLFVFYSAMILYYGAAFTKVWGIYIKQPIKPSPHAEFYSYRRVAGTHED